ncbi:hypothetical protein [Rhizobium sp. Rhizsp82]|uniref:hypothetical protein n=1 Tax=Rhizobium sp. Rhizsp82 TaxID=3243057 RepID=UPI0039B60A72
MSDNSMEIAAKWLADQLAGNPRAIPDLKVRFGFTAKEACEAVARANAIRAERARA